MNTEAVILNINFKATDLKKNFSSKFIVINFVKKKKNEVK